MHGAHRPTPFPFAMYICRLSCPVLSERKSIIAGSYRKSANVAKRMSVVARQADMQAA